MNAKELAGNLGLEEDEFFELVELFLETGNSDLDILQSAIGKGNVSEAAGAAHSIKGAAGNLGFMDIHEAAKKIEANLRSNWLKGAPEAAQELKKKLNVIAELVERKG